MEDLEASLATFYDQQADWRENHRPEAVRVEALKSFIQQMQEEGRGRICEVGAGAGHDAAMIRRKVQLVAIDLSAANAALCRDKDVSSVVASAAHLPFARKSFDGLWTMSTLLHVPNDRIHDVLTELTSCLIPGSPMAIGVWGGEDRQEVYDGDTFEPKRFYSFRSDTSLRGILSSHGAIEAFRTWESPHSEQHYQYCIVRARG